MVKVLIGEYKHQLDDKSRLRLPYKLRREFTNGYVISRGTNGCLFVFSQEEINRIIEKVKLLPLSDINAWKPMRYILSSASEIEEDTQGRFVLPSNLIEFAGIQKCAVIIGAGTHVEIWSEEKWNAYTIGTENINNANQDEFSKTFDSIISDLKTYGI